MKTSSLAKCLMTAALLSTITFGLTGCYGNFSGSETVSTSEDQIDSTTSKTVVVGNLVDHSRVVNLEIRCLDGDAFLYVEYRSGYDGNVLTRYPEKDRSCRDFNSVNPEGTTEEKAASESPESKSK